MNATILLCLLTVACTPAPAASTRTAATTSRQEHSTVQSASIGQAEMKDDGTIVLTLRAESDSGAIGDGRFSYPPTHAEYDKIRKHVGPIEKGQTKPVPPWPSDGKR